MSISISVTILQDLWDFDQEDSELSQDSDTEEDADTDRSDIHMEVSWCQSYCIRANRHR